MLRVYVWTASAFRSNLRAGDGPFIFSQGTLPAPPHPLGWESQLLLVQCRPVGSCLEVHIVRCCVPQLILGERTCEAAVCLSAVHVGTLIGPLCMMHIYLTTYTTIRHI